MKTLRKCRGITMVELMIVLAILGILMGLVVPNYATIIAEQSVAAETKRMINTLKLARSEARARGATVTISRAATDDWSAPLMVYESTVVAGNADFGVTAGTGSDDLIKNFPGTSRDITARDNANSNGQFISFNMRGWLSSSETSEILIAVCSPVLDDGRGRYIEINRVGKIRERPIGNDNRGCL